MEISQCLLSVASLDSRIKNFPFTKSTSGFEPRPWMKTPFVAEVREKMNRKSFKSSEVELMYRIDSWLECINNMKNKPTMVPHAQRTKGKDSNKSDVRFKPGRSNSLDSVVNVSPMRSRSSFSFFLYLSTYLYSL